MSEVKQHKPGLADEANAKAGYKHTPLGYIPKEWEVMRFTDICELKHGFQFREEHFDEIGVPIIKIGSLVNGAGIRTDNLTYVKQDIAEQCSAFKVNPGDILMALTGGTLGKVSIFPKVEGLYLQNYRVGNFLPKNNSTKDYILHLLQSYFIQTKIEDYVNEAAQPNFGKQDFDKLKVPVPPLPEQHSIAAILSTWDEAITKTHKLIALLQLRNKGLMQQLLTDRNNWKEYRIGDLLKEVKRPVKWNDEELYYLISVRRRSGGAFFRESLYGKQILTKQLFTAQEGDFLISKMQIVHGASAVVPKELSGMKISGSYIAVHTKDEMVMDINFFNWLSKTRWFYKLTYVSSYGVHIEKMTFDYDDFKRRKIMLPPSVEEQKKIVQILRTASEEVMFYEHMLTTLQQQKKGLMQVLLTGEVRVKFNKM